MRRSRASVDRIAGDRGDERNVGSGDLLRLVLGAGARRVEHQAVEARSSSLKVSGRRNRSRRSPVTRFSPAARRSARSSADSAAASPSTACTSDLPRQPQRKGAAAGEQVGDPSWRAPDGAPTSSAIAASAARSPAGSRPAARDGNAVEHDHGFFGSTTISPSTDSRAKPCAMTKLEAARRASFDSLPARWRRRRGRIAVTVTVMRNGVGASARSARRAPAARSSAATISGSRDRAFLDRDDLVATAPGCSRAACRRRSAAPRTRPGGASAARRRRVARPASRCRRAFSASTTLSRFQAR